MGERGYTGDAALFVRWFIEQGPGWRHAREIRDVFLSGEIRLSTPDTVRFEVAHVLRKEGLLKNRLDLGDYLAAVRAIDDLDVEIVAVTADHLERAAALAGQYSLSIFDALVVACSVETELPVLTSDARLANAVGHVAQIRLLRPD